MAKEQLVERTLDELDETQMVPMHDIGFDLAVGGGVPTGCIAEIYGQEASGKTTICFEIASRFLDEFPKKFVYYYNYERSIDKFYVRNLLGNDSDRLKRFKIVEPEFLEDGMNHLLQVLDSDLGSLCIIDSLAAMTPKDENSKALDKAQVGGFKAKIMAEVCRKIGARLGKGSKTLVLFINHMNPVLGGFSFIPQSTTPGGKAVKFWASLRLEVSVIDRLYHEEVTVGTGKKERIPYGNICKIKVEKNKFYAPYKRCVVVIMLGKGISRSFPLIDYGLQLGLVGLKGKTDYYLTGRESSTIRGKANFAALIDRSPAVFNYLYEHIYKIIQEKRKEAQNPNVECLSKPEVFQKGDESLEQGTESEVGEMFRGLQTDAQDSQEDDSEDDFEVPSNSNSELEDI